jgi:hypothetical protein
MKNVYISYYLIAMCVMIGPDALGPTFFSLCSLLLLVCSGPALPLISIPLFYSLDLLFCPEDEAASSSETLVLSTGLHHITEDSNLQRRFVHTLG